MKYNVMVALMMKSGIKLIGIGLLLGWVLAGCTNYTIPGKGSGNITANSCEGCHTDYKRLIALHRQVVVVDLLRTMSHMTVYTWEEPGMILSKLQVTIALAVQDAITETGVPEINMKPIQATGSSLHRWRMRRNV